MLFATQMGYVHLAEDLCFPYFSRKKEEKKREEKKYAQQNEAFKSVTASMLKLTMYGILNIIIK